MEVEVNVKTEVVEPEQVPEATPEGAAEAKTEDTKQTEEPSAGAAPAEDGSAPVPMEE